MGDPIVVPAAPANNNTVVVPKRVFNDVKTVGVEVTSNHFLLKDNTSDWTKAGNLYPKPEFKFGVKSAPVSCTRDQTLTVTVTFEVWPKDAPLRDCAIKGATPWGLAFETKAPLKGGVNPVKCVDRWKASTSKIEPYVTSGSGGTFDDVMWSTLVDPT